MAILSFNIPDDKVAVLSARFVKVLPITVDAEGEPVMDETAWIRRNIIAHVMNICDIGKKMIADELNTEEDLIS